MRRALAGLIVVVVLAAGVGGGWWWTRREAQRDAAARAVLTAYVDGWRTRTLFGVPFTDSAAAEDFSRAVAGLREATLEVGAEGFRRDRANATADLRVTWTLPGGVPWTYAAPVRLVEVDGRWRVAGPGEGTAWHPELPAGETMTPERTAARRGDLLDRDGEPLPSTRTFGQPLLGRVGEATTETRAESDGRYADGDVVGRSGLQAQYETTLAGTAGRSVVSSGGRTLFAVDPVPGEDVATTLDPRVQRAAESALSAARLDAAGAIVAVDVATGEVLAAANTPTTGTDRALAGRYPPGSTMTVASAYAYLTGGVTTPESIVPCPDSVTVDGRSFRNDVGEPTTGDVPFAEAFASSCTTAFVSLSQRLGRTELRDAAADLGVGAGWSDSLGVDGAFDGSVTPTGPGADLAAAVVGRAGTEVSPLALAVMTGSIARGTYLPPVLVPDGTGAPRPAPLDGRAVGDIRSMLADVVTTGTGTALRNTPGGTVRGKTGTADRGADEEPLVWFTGYQGDVAFTVVVEAGVSGGATAAPLAKRFLGALADA